MNMDKDPVNNIPELFDMFFNESRDGLILLDAPTGIIKLVNPEFQNQIGLPLEKIIGKPIWNLRPPQDRSLGKALYQQRFNSNVKLSTHEVIYQRGDKTKIVVELLSKLLEYDGKKHLIIITRDVTASKQIGRISRITQFAVDNAGDVIIWLDSLGNIVYANKSTTKLLGYSKEALLSMAIWDLDMNITPSIWEKYSAASGETFSDMKETLFKAKNNLLIPISIAVNRLVYEGVTYNCIFARDLSESKRTEEALLRTQFAFDHAADAIFWLDDQGQFIYSNNATTELLGYSKRELYHMRIDYIDINFPRSSWESEFQQLKKDNYGYIETLYRTKKCNFIPVSVMGNYLNYAGKDFNCCFVRDLSEIKQVDKAYRMAQFAIDTSGDAIFWLDRNGKILYSNRATTELLGYSSTQLSNMTINELDPTVVLEEWPSRFDALKSLGSDVVESVLKTKDGTILPVSIMGNYLNYDGKEYNFVFVRDISERLKIEEALRQQQALLEKTVLERTSELTNTNSLLQVEITERKNAEKKLEKLLKEEALLRQEIENQMAQRIEFSRALVHELKTPLTPILGASAILAKNFTEEPWHSVALNIENGAQNLNKRVDELLDVARGEIGILSIKPNWFDPLKLLNELSNYVAPEASLNKQVFVTELPDKLPLVWADKERLQQIVLNFLDNAFKYTPRNGQVTLRAYTCSNNLVIEVQDTGPGILEEEKARIFKAYARFKKQCRRESGLGLGLALAAMIVELHKGKIWCDSIGN
ncbi:PAS domain-containing sensor histidine kinase [Dehalococcoides mccartyi]|uniref:histidine kinase n=1 Tax=Dehalococcoides mccartyi (strain VS) TaxID=311424 RepID=D2BG16_DEHMV|nr:PAS domain S-box protein [Dehalococcoides mccartyi]ACZ61266.1 sensor histidine kinase [Dehalococcoides mccartyi VS]